MDLNSFRTDKKLEVDGVWFDFDEDTSVKVARGNNVHFTKLLTKLSKPVQALARTGNLPEDKASEIVAKAMAETILLDWKGIKLDGKVVKYSVENAAKILKDLPDFRDLINELANDRAAFAEEIAEESKGN
ncbi:hypothetical protein [uncultured Roseibium sp.]|uniref:hypothetical protein n=1 Tax=uncultured Roseibium sp. TaxID=1936171 RepID=UPI0026138E85|nr:hypothetical protein [uncultured Roseibium sp.]